MTRTIVPVILALTWLVIGCTIPNPSASREQPEADPDTSQSAAKEEDPVMAFELTSPAFRSGETIPTPFTCDGENKSPPLYWSQVPQGAASLALVMDDPDAPSGTFVHWVFYNLPPEVEMISEGVQPDDIASLGGANGSNGRGQAGYTGPCPPSGEHRYFFKLYALDTALELPSIPTKAVLEAAMMDHVLGQAQLMGTYAR